MTERCEQDENKCKWICVFSVLLPCAGGFSDAITEKQTQHPDITLI